MRVPQEGLASCYAVHSPGEGQGRCPRSLEPRDVPAAVGGPSGGSGRLGLLSLSLLPPSLLAKLRPAGELSRLLPLVSPVTGTATTPWLPCSNRPRLPAPNLLLPPARLLPMVSPVKGRASTPSN